MDVGYFMAIDNEKKMEPKWIVKSRSGLLHIYDMEKYREGESGGG